MFTAPTSALIWFVHLVLTARPDTSAFQASSAVNSGQPDSPPVEPAAFSLAFFLLRAAQATALTTATLTAAINASKRMPELIPALLHERETGARLASVRKSAPCGRPCSCSPPTCAKKRSGATTA